MFHHELQQQEVKNEFINVKYESSLLWVVKRFILAASKNTTVLFSYRVGALR